MKYRKFGNTGANVSILGFGAMRLPMVGEGENQQVDLDKSVPLIQKGMDSRHQLYRHGLGLSESNQ